MQPISAPRAHQRPIGLQVNLLHVRAHQLQCKQHKGRRAYRGLHPGPCPRAHLPHCVQCLRVRQVLLHEGSAEPHRKICARTREREAVGEPCVSWCVAGATTAFWLSANASGAHRDERPREPRPSPLRRSHRYLGCRAASAPTCPARCTRSSLPGRCTLRHTGTGRPA